MLAKVSHMFTAGGMTGFALTGHSLCLQVNLLRDSEGIIDLDAQISNRTLKLCVTKQDLNGSWRRCGPHAPRGGSPELARDGHEMEYADI